MSSLGFPISAKNQILDSDEGVDRISDLPDEILCKIMRFLSTKYAVRTGILSTRWKGLFWLTNDLNLDFDDYPLHLSSVEDRSTHRQRPELRFIDFIYRCFRVLRGNVKDINKFKLRTHLKHEDQETHLNNWISSALEFNVKEVDLEMGHTRSEFVVPASETLAVLKLKGYMKIGIHDSVGLPNLKVLHLVGVSIKDEDFKRISKECHALEELVLKLMNNFTVLDISTPALKRVTIDRIFDEDAPGIDLVLDAPNIQYFHFNDDLPASISANLSSLVEAHIRVCARSNEDEEDVQSLTKLLKGCRQVRVLKLSWKTLRGILYLDTYSFYVFHNLKHLVLGKLYASEWAFLRNLLQLSPNLETLVFEEGFSKGNGCQPGTFIPNIVPSCVSSHLTSIELKEFEDEECELKFVGYFLARAKVLQIMRICTKKGSGEPFELTEKLLKLPRSSKECQVVVTSGFN